MFNSGSGSLGSNIGGMLGGFAGSALGGPVGGFAGMAAGSALGRAMSGGFGGMGGTATNSGSIGSHASNQNFSGLSNTSVPTTLTNKEINPQTGKINPVVWSAAGWVRNPAYTAQQEADDPHLSGYKQFKAWAGDKSNPYDEVLIPGISGEGFLSSGYDNALGSLKNALARGQLTQSGYDASVKGLDTQRSGYVEDANSLANGVIASARAPIISAVDDQWAAFRDKKARDDFDFDTFYNDIVTKAGTASNGINDRINTLIKNAGYFDVPGLITQGGAAQGAVNKPGASLLAALQKSKNPHAGLGNQGVF